jgi:DNA invertase Pin-like site-specific DNA recombinase
MLRADDTLVVRWVERLGRNYTDVVDTIREFMRRGVIIKTVINGMTFDGRTTDPMQQAVRDALIAFMAATARTQAGATKSAQRAGINQRVPRATQTPLLSAYPLRDWPRSLFGGLAPLSRGPSPHFQLRQCRTNWG